MNYCDWTERVNANGSEIWKCSNETEEKQDEYGRAYCTEHRIKVDQINKSRHKNCINKEKLIEYLSKYLSCGFTKEYIIKLLSNVQYSDYDIDIGLMDIFIV